MLYLNTRHSLPRIGIDMHASTLSSRIQKPTVDSSYSAPKSTMGMTQATVDVDSYPSRQAYGARKMADFTREKGQQGFADLRSATSRHTQDAWAMIDNAAKKGTDEIANLAHGRLSSEIHKQRHLEAQAIPDPVITAHPGETHGGTEPAQQDYRINVADKADVTFNRGNISIYLEDKGFIRNWVSEGRYDIYA